MKDLPDDLGSLDAAELTEQRELRDKMTAPLFRRWPALDRMEAIRLKKRYDETLRIARHLGRRGPRRDQRRPSVLRASGHEPERAEAPDALTDTARDSPTAS